MALDYKKRLQAIDPDINYLMTLYLHESMIANPDIIREAKKAGIAGVKSYPAGVTTNSSSGVLSYEPFYPVFAVMQEVGLVLNLHGEVPSDKKEITVLNAEPKFLPTFLDLHERFPRLKIVLEHVTTADAVEAVRSCGETVVGTITAHHLSLVVDNWAGDVVSALYSRAVIKSTPCLLTTVCSSASASPSPRLLLIVVLSSTQRYIATGNSFSARIVLVSSPSHFHQPV